MMHLKDLFKSLTAMATPTLPKPSKKRETYLKTLAGIKDAILALNVERDEILASGNTFEELTLKMKRAGHPSRSFVFAPNITAGTKPFVI